MVRAISITGMGASCVRGSKSVNYAQKLRWDLFCCGHCLRNGTQVSPYIHWVYLTLLCCNMDSVQMTAHAPIMSHVQVCMFVCLPTPCLLLRFHAGFLLNSSCRMSVLLLLL
jgi:hypothetical protein